VADRTDPDEIQREIERTRAELAETIDAIADRVSPKRVTARTVERVRAVVKGNGAARPQVVVDASTVARVQPGGVPTEADRHEIDARATGLPSGAVYAVRRRLRTDRVLMVAGALTAVVAVVIVVRRRAGAESG